MSWKKNNFNNNVNSINNINNINTTNSLIKENDTVPASFKFEYLQNKNAFKISIVNIQDQNIKNIFKNTFKIDGILLDIDQDSKNNAFPIKVAIKCEIKKLSSGNFIGKNQGAYAIISGPKNKTYFLKFSIDARNPHSEGQLFLSTAIVVYEKFNGKLYNVFGASKIINTAALSKQTINNLNPTYNEDIKNNALANKKYNYYYQEQKEKNDSKRSKSLNTFNNSSFRFNQKSKEILEDNMFEKKFSYLNINNIPHLTKSICSKIFGFENLGNTCFLNSSLQIIIHSHIFIQKFFEDIARIKPGEDSVAYEFFNLIMNIASNDQKVFSPKKLISRFTKKCDMFSLGQQSDSQRFYRNFLTILEKELGPNNTCVKNSFSGEIVYTMQNRCSNPLCGKYFDQNQNKQPFYDIFLSLPENESSLDGLISLTYKPQIISLKKKCSCGSNLNVIRFSAIKPNFYFNMNIQRVKIATRNLKNTKIIIDNIYKEGDYFYEPYAINFHVGSSMDFGHYYSYVKVDSFDENENSRWYNFNDRSYEPIHIDFPFSSESAINIVYRLKKYSK